MTRLPRRAFVITGDGFGETERGGGMRAIERPVESISLNQVMEGTKLELRIHGESAKGDRTTFLTARDARLLAYALLAEAEKLKLS